MVIANNSSVDSGKQTFSQCSKKYLCSYYQQIFFWELAIEDGDSIYSTRLNANNNLNVPFMSRSRWQQSLRYRSAVLWNSIVREIRDAVPTDKFKKLLKRYFIYTY